MGLDRIGSVCLGSIPREGWLKVCVPRAWVGHVVVLRMVMNVGIMDRVNLRSLPRNGLLDD